ncbi:MAG TPA: hypothetical protein VMI53_02995 [Opitutaceae bacterium]|nr:hypothetical protein [Opitutaceae bacterium]
MARKCMVRLFALGGLALVFSGCNTPETTRLDFTTPAGVQGTPVAPSKSSLRVAWLAVEDQRLDATSLGHIGSRAYVAKSFLPWLDQQLRAVKGTNFAEAGDPARADLVIKPILLKLYIQNIEVTKSAVVVLRLEFSSHGKSSGQLTCRGQYAGMNWWGSDEEMAGAIQEAFTDCLRNISASLELNIKLQHITGTASGANEGLGLN